MTTADRDNLTALVARCGLPAVLATLRTLVQGEADEMVEMADPADAGKADKLEAIGSALLGLASDYDAI